MLTAAEALQLILDTDSNQTDSTCTHGDCALHGPAAVHTEGNQP
jgi:hypothetical protein